MTTEQLVDYVAFLDVNVDVWFPERLIVDGWLIPLTENEQLLKSPSLVGKTFVTVGETFILFMLRAIRKKQIDSLELWCGDMRIGIGRDGSMIDYWDGGFFETGFNLRFH
jgi:hypothetical protein